jgi:hypothetical protein
LKRKADALDAAAFLRAAALPDSRQEESGEAEQNEHGRHAFG